MAEDPTLYASGIGDRLIDAARYPVEIRKFLESEADALERLAGTFDRLVEVGAMEGRHVDWALARDKRYIGIDATRKYVEAGVAQLRERKLPKDRFSLLHARAEELHRLPELRDKTRSLLFFPFNSIGNMDELGAVLRSLAAVGMPYLISTYTTSEEATNARASYYANCAFDGLRRSDDERGVCFRSCDGLCSIAFNHDYFLRVCRINALAVESVRLGAFGVAYLQPGLKVVSKSEGPGE